MYSFWVKNSHLPSGSQYSLLIRPSFSELSCSYLYLMRSVKRRVTFTMGRLL